MAENKISRRDFLHKSALAGGAIVLPSMLAGCVSGKGPKKTASPKVVGANEKVDVALIGIGNRGAEVSKQFIKTGLCNVVALCDVDMGAKHTQEIESMFPDVPKYKDFRKLFDEMSGKIDAVMVATPDHSHFPICMAAMREGIHVYVEKPLARTFYECEMLMEAEKKYGVVTQMGNQGHSEANYFQFKVERRRHHKGCHGDYGTYEQPSPLAQMGSEDGKLSESRAASRYARLGYLALCRSGARLQPRLP